MQYSFFTWPQKTAAVLTGLALSLTLMVPVHAADQDLPDADYADRVLTDFEGYTNPFPDTSLTTLEGRAAAELSRRGVINGQADGRFHGNLPVNRAEALKFLWLSRHDTVPDDELSGDEYADVESDDWFYPYVAVGTNEGIINGYPDGYFRPERTVNTVEFLKMLALTFDLELNLPYSYRDTDSTQWYAKYLGIAQKYDLFPQRSTFILPTDALTRDEVAVAMYEYLKNRTDLPDEDDDSEADLRLSVKTLTNATYGVNSGNAILWQGTLSAPEAMEVEIEQLGFKNIGTAEDEDLENLTLTVEGAGMTTVTSDAVEMTDGKVVFDALWDANETIDLSATDTIQLTVRGRVADELSATAPTVQLELDLDAFEVTDSDDEFLTVFRTSSNRASLTATLTEADGQTGGGDDDLLKAYSRTPDSRILVTGSEENIVGAFELKSTLEDAEINELTFNIEEIDTNGEFDTNIANDDEAIDGLTLLYADGRPVLKQNGDEARVSTLTNGKARFTDLDLTAEEDEKLLIFVAVDIAAGGDNGVAESGMAFAVNLSTTASENEIRGGTTGANIAITSIGGGDPDNQGNTFYVLNNRLTAQEVTTTESLTSGDQRDLIKFRLSKAESTRDAFLRQIWVTIATTDAATVENVGLYNDDNELIAFAAEPVSGDSFSLIVGIEDEDGDEENDPGTASENNLTFDEDSLVNLPSGSDDLYEEISNNEVFTLRGDINTDGNDDQVVIMIEINGAEIGEDGILWRDEEDGVNVRWINLDQDDDAITRLEHVLEN